MFLNSLTGKAAGIKRENNRKYAKDEFLAQYPQFKTLVPDTMLDIYLNMANNSISDERFHSAWELACGLFVAHFCTLYIESLTPENSTADDVISKAGAVGVVTSESADGVSYSRDTGSILADLSGWAAFKSTTFGVQFITLANLYGKGGMYVW